jgi:hypothetical protein
MIEIHDLTIPLIFGYAEIHYHLKWLFPKYFITQPEIIFDCPIRCIKARTKDLPILLIIKDSYKYPIELINATVVIKGTNGEKRYKFTFEETIKNKYYSTILNCNIEDFDSEQKLEILCKSKIKIMGESFEVIQDNYKGLSKQSFECYLSAENLPYPDYWYAGEPHYHSIYTNDQVEFGADIKSTKVLAKAMGLDWFFVTDHSYDLDDKENNYTQNDPNLPKWKKMKEDCKQNDEEKFRVIAGEEVSIGNYKKENVHLLVINNPIFIEGWGDSAEIWFKNKPQNLISNLPKAKDDQLYIAAHPSDNVPFMQKFTLRRGKWYDIDFEDNEIKFLQLINSADQHDVEKSIKFWKAKLLSGKRYMLLAGNDAHGNFNSMRQISQPFLKLFSSKKQVFGNFQTIFYYMGNFPIQGIKNGRILVGNGPFLDFHIKTKNKQIYTGMEFDASIATLEFIFKTTVEFGEAKKLILHLGKGKKEEDILNPKNFMKIDLQRVKYLRMSVLTTNGYRAFTNPIFNSKI